MERDPEDRLGGGEGYIGHPDDTAGFENVVRLEDVGVEHQRVGLATSTSVRARDREKMAHRFARCRDGCEVDDRVNPAVARVDVREEPEHLTIILQVGIDVPCVDGSLGRSRRNDVHYER